MNDYEIRTYKNIEFKSTNIDGIEQNTIEGYAVLWDSPSEILYNEIKKKKYIEYIDKDAFNQDVIDNSDIKLLLNHKPELIIGVHNSDVKTFELKIDDFGLYIKTLLIPNTQTAKDTIELLKLGILFQMSFAFCWTSDSWNSDYTERHITEIDRLMDVSIVSYPVFPETNVKLSKKSLDVIESNEKTLEAEQPKETPVEPVINATPKYKMLLDILKSKYKK
jgi:uncharacterized protein